MQGTFQITGWDETAYQENADGSKKTHAKITQEYCGDISGSSELQYLMSYQSDGSAVFTGFETISGTVAEKSGTLTLQHSGKFENGVASSNFVIVADSGSGELSGITGSGRFKSGQGGTANYQLEFALA